MKYRSKPTIKEAIQLTPESFLECVRFIGYENLKEILEGQTLLIIKTLEGNMSANKGDYIIKGIANEFYACKPEIFEASYELVE